MSRWDSDKKSKTNLKNVSASVLKSVFLVLYSFIYSFRGEKLFRNKVLQGDFGSKYGFDGMMYGKDGTMYGVDRTKYGFRGSKYGWG